MRARTFVSNVNVWMCLCKTLHIPMHAKDTREREGDVDGEKYLLFEKEGGGGVSELRIIICVHAGDEWSWQRQWTKIVSSLQFRLRMW
jgi:hypothetical protein